MMPCRYWNSAHYRFHYPRQKVMKKHFTNFFFPSNDDYHVHHNRTAPTYCQLVKVTHLTKCSLSFRNPEPPASLETEVISCSLYSIPALHSTTLSTPVPCVHTTALLCFLSGVHKFSKILGPEGDTKAVPYRVCTNTGCHCTN